MPQTFGTAAQAQAALSLIRIVAGFTFMAHGYQKFFINGIPGVTGFFDQVGVPLAGIMAIVVATVEFVGGFALMTGFFARFVAVPLAIDMTGAIFFVHAKHGFFGPMGVEFVLLLMTSAIAIAIAGPGRFSIDAAFAGKRNNAKARGE
jgi:putative oxidoreductase